MSNLEKRTVAAVQMYSRPGEVSRNRASAGRLIDQHIESSIDLILLPELFNVGYFIGPELFDLSETEDGPTVTWMRECAAEKGAIIAGTIAERRGDRLLNTLFLAEPDGRLHRYSKRKPTKAERTVFDPGTDSNIVETSLGRLGLVICADINWGKELLQPLAGTVDLILVPMASMVPSLLNEWISSWEQRHCRPFLAQMNVFIGAPVMFAGLFGPVQRLTRFFTCTLAGGTWITDVHGRALAGVPCGVEGVAITDLCLGSTGGDPHAKAFRDPGCVKKCLSHLLHPLPNQRRPSF